MSDIRCCALNKNGLRCTSDAVADTEWWRCLKHLDWYRTATRKEREILARLEIEQAFAELGAIPSEDLDTRR